MGLIKYMAKEAIKEIGNKSREFYEFVLPAVDMHVDDNFLTVIIDMPGFEKQDIKLKIQSSILSIKAEKNNEKQLDGSIIWKQRPNVVDKKLKLPIKIKEGEGSVESAKFSDGVLTVKFAIENSGKQISIE